MGVQLLFSSGKNYECHAVAAINKTSTSTGFIFDYGELVNKGKSIFAVK